MSNHFVPCCMLMYRPISSYSYSYCFSPPVDFDECQSDPCLNGGECNNGFSKYSCSCSPGYEGDDCGTGKRYMNDIHCSVCR